MLAYLGWGGRKWKMPFMNLEMRGCFPNWTPSTGIWVTDIRIQGAVLLAFVNNLLYRRVNGINTLF